MSVSLLCSVWVHFPTLFLPHECQGCHVNPAWGSGVKRDTGEEPKGWMRLSMPAFVLPAGVHHLWPQTQGMAKALCSMGMNFSSDVCFRGL